MTANSSQQPGSDLRLPTSVSPTAYDLTIRPDIEAETFSGTVRISVDCRESTDTVTLNSHGLAIDRADVVAGAGVEATDDDRRTVTVRPEPAAEKLHLELDRPLPVGPATVELSFSGTFDESLVGFYLSRYTDADGNQQALATTEFEAPYARRCFPCWDEPAFKATFTVSLIVDPAHQAITNAPEVGRRLLDDGPDAGRLRVDFAPTVPMSTYLVAMVVGPLETSETVDVDGIDLRVIYPPGKGELTAFALEAGAFALRYFSEYFAVPYPGPKLDLIAIPDFAFGAMENLGCVTFREALLLIDPRRATHDELQRVTDVINHEIAHMWFGDLVTMAWWNGIWLNEAFATFMEMKCTDAFRPHWDRWTDFGLSLGAAYAIDALHATRPIEYEVITPEDAEGMFDSLTYEKGAAVVRMLEQYLGEETFRSGIRLYMDRHKFANAETTDLWNAIEEASGEPVRAMMDTWIFQGGFPTIEVGADDTSITLSQRRASPLAADAEDGEAADGGQPLVEDEDQEWLVPVQYRFLDGDPPEQAEDGPGVERLLLSGPTTIAVEGNDPDRWLGNAGRAGFYRLNYGEERLHRLGDVAREQLTSIERYGLIDDAWAGVMAGAYTTPTFLNLLEAMTAETSRPVWVRIIGGFSALGRLVEGEAEERLQEIVHDAIAPTLAGLGLGPEPDDDDGRRQLRGDLIKALGVEARDPEIIDEAKRTVAVGRRDPELVETAVFSAAVSVVARNGDATDFADFDQAWRTARTPQDEMRFLYALADFPDPELADRLHQLLLDGSIRTQNAPLLLNRALTNPQTGRRNWAFITREWDRLVDMVATGLVVRMLQSVPVLDRPDDYRATKQFLADHKVPVSPMRLNQILERQRIAVALRAREAERLSRFLTA